MSNFLAAGFLAHFFIFRKYPTDPNHFISGVVMDGFWGVLLSLGLGGKVGKAGRSYFCHRSHHTSTWVASLVRAHLSVLAERKQREFLRREGGRASVWPSPLFIHPVAWGICLWKLSGAYVGPVPPWCWVSALPHAPTVSLHLFQVFALPKRCPLWPGYLMVQSSVLWVFPILLQDREDYSKHTPVDLGWCSV